MKRDILINSIKYADETIVIADECGDSMWDAVLEQEVKRCRIKTNDGNLNLLPGSDEIIQIDNAIKA